MQKSKKMITYVAAIMLSLSLAGSSSANVSVAGAGSGISKPNPGNIVTLPSGGTVIVLPEHENVPPVTDQPLPPVDEDGDEVEYGYETAETMPAIMGGDDDEDSYHEENTPGTGAGTGSSTDDTNDGTVTESPYLSVDDISKTDGTNSEGTGVGTGSGQNAVNVASGAYLISYAEANTLQQRLGELREEQRANGAWFRVHGGKFESADKNVVKSIEMKYGGVQIGYDRKVDATNGDLYYGVMFGYSKGDLEYLNSGKSKVDSKTAGAYATYKHTDGAYADVTIKYQWIDNDFETLDSAGGRVTGDKIRTGGFGASLEIGQRFYLGNDKELGWYLQPLAQISYQKQSDGSFKASNGLKIAVESFSSLIGRAGIMAGYSYGDNNFYVKAAMEKEFKGSVNIIAGDKLIAEDFGGSRWIIGAGFTSKLTGTQSLYFNIDHTKGEHFSRPWSINAGWRIML